MAPGVSLNMRMWTYLKHLPVNPNPCVTPAYIAICNESLCSVTEVLLTMFGIQASSGQCENTGDILSRIIWGSSKQ